MRYRSVFSIFLALVWLPFTFLALRRGGHYNVDLQQYRSREKRGPALIGDRRILQTAGIDTAKQKKVSSSGRSADANVSNTGWLVRAIRSAAANRRVAGARGAS